MTTRRDPYGIRVQEFTQFGKLQDQHHRAAQPPLQSLVIELLAFISALFWFCRCVRTRAQLLASCYCIARTSWKNVKLTKITRITETEIIPPYYNLKMSLDKRRKRIIRVHFYCQKPKNEATKMFSIIPFSRGARKIVLHGTRAIETKQRTPLGRLMPNALPPY
jgi:hypothetical protein